jgi:hypothetical protein
MTAHQRLNLWTGNWFRRQRLLSSFNIAGILKQVWKNSDGEWARYASDVRAQM